MGLRRGQRITLRRPRVTLRISHITVLLVAVVIVTPLVLSLLVVSSVNAMVDEYVPAGQEASAQQVALEVFAAFFGDAVEAVEDARHHLVEVAAARDAPRLWRAEESVVAIAIARGGDGTPGPTLSDSSVTVQCPPDAALHGDEGSFLAQALFGTVVVVIVDVELWETEAHSMAFPPPQRLVEARRDAAVECVWRAGESSADQAQLRPTTRWMPGASNATDGSGTAWIPSLLPGVSYTSEEIRRRISTLREGLAMPAMVLPPHLDIAFGNSSGSSGTVALDGGPLPRLTFIRGVHVAAAVAIAQDEFTLVVNETGASDGGASPQPHGDGHGAPHLSVKVRTTWALAANRTFNLTVVGEALARGGTPGDTSALFDASTGWMPGCVSVPARQPRGSGSITGDIARASIDFFTDGTANEAALRTCAPVVAFVKDFGEALRAASTSTLQVTRGGFIFTAARVPVSAALFGNATQLRRTDSAMWYAVHATATASYLTPLLETRGKIVVTAFAIGAITVVLLLLMMRTVLHPLRAISRAVHCCAVLDLESIEIMEASSVSEICEIQRSISYLAIRLYHYLRFLPDRVVLGKVRAVHGTDGSHSRRRRLADAYDAESALLNETANSGGASNTLRTLDVPMLLTDHPSFFSSAETQDPMTGNQTDRPSGNDPTSSDDSDDVAADDSDEDAVVRERARRAKLLSYNNSLSDAPLHSIAINILYESRHTARNDDRRWQQPNKMARFIFQYRITDPVHSMLLRACRLHLNERPGEVLVLFVKTSEGKRQLATDEDVLFAFEFFCVHGEDAYVDITVRKGANRTTLPLLIALGTFFSVLSRLVLASERMSHDDGRVQLLGLLLLSCVAMQLAQNLIISLYVLHRFDILDDEFRAWHAVSRAEAFLGVFFGTFNVTNLEIMACHVRLHRGFRLSAPLSPKLLQKIRKYSLMGFLIGDVIPFIIIVIEAVLRKLYQDPFIVMSLFFSVLSVTSILIRHGIIRFIVDDVVRSKDGIRNAATKSLLLSRKEVTVLRVVVTGERQLFALLSPDLIDVLCEALYGSISPLAKKFGGLAITSVGLSVTMVFNAHTVIPHHAHTALQCFAAILEEVEVRVLQRFFESQEMRAHVAAAQQQQHRSKRENGAAKQPPAAAAGVDMMPFHRQHRVTGSVCTGEMCLGYIGTLTSQTLQHVDELQHLAVALTNLCGHYGATVLCDAETVHSPGVLTDVVARRIDKLVLDSCFYAAPGTTAAAQAARDPEERHDDHPHRDDDILNGAASQLPHDTNCNKDDYADNAGDRAPTIEVFEVVVSDFLHTKEPASPADLHARRFAAPTAETLECVKTFDAAIDYLFSVGSAVNVARYVKRHPNDLVAARIHQWAQFFGAANELQWVRFPRVVSSLGVQRHRCERPGGGAGETTVAQPVFVSDAADTMLQGVAERECDRARRFRPSRAERRLRDPAQLTSSSMVLEQAMSRKAFHVDFGPVPPPQQPAAPQRKQQPVRFGGDL